MINKQDALSISEAEKIFEEANSTKDLKPFFGKFAKLKVSDAKKLRKEIEDSGIVKLKPEFVAKIIDLLPRDNEDLNKIFVDVSLDKNEADKILEIVKQYK